MIKNMTWILILTVFLSSCASLKDSMLIGVASGAASGAGIGYAADNSSKGALIGAASGALFGAGLSYLIHKEQQKKGLVMKTPEGKPKYPFLNRAEVRAIWVPDKIDDDGKTYVEGHFMYLIDKQSTWSKE